MGKWQEAVTSIPKPRPTTIDEKKRVFHNKVKTLSLNWITSKKDIAFFKVCNINCTFFWYNCGIIFLACPRTRGFHQLSKDHKLFKNQITMMGTKKINFFKNCRIDTTKNPNPSFHHVRCVVSILAADDTKGRLLIRFTGW